MTLFPEGTIKKLAGLQTYKLLQMQCGKPTVGLHHGLITAMPNAARNCRAVDVAESITQTRVPTIDTIYTS